LKPKHHGVGFLRIRHGYFFELLKGIIKRDEGNWFPGSCDNLSTLLLPDCHVLVGESLARNHVKGLIQPLGYFLVPICEVGLIFAAMGKALGVFPDDIFSMMVIVIMFTTIVPPPILNALLKRQETA